MSLSRESLDLFANLLGQVQIPASAPDLEEQAALVARAKREIAEDLRRIGPPLGDHGPDPERGVLDGAEQA